MERKRRATLRDVADRAQVSTAVVSYVINNGPRPTSPEVRDRVRRAIAELDYHPNGFARGLRARRTHTIAFISYDWHQAESLGSTYIASILRALAAELKERGYYLLLYPMLIGEDPAPLQSLLRGSRLDGIVLRLIQDPPATDALLELVTQADIPCVCIERSAAPRFGLRSVTYDNTGGAYLATRHLIEQGHRRIAHLQGDARYATARERLAGYRQALAEADLPFDETLVRVANWGMTEAAAAIPELMTLPAPPTAIFAASDDMALGALERLRAMGYRVPEDVALVGFDGILLAQQVIPPLTTIRVPFAEIGHRAAELVLGDTDQTTPPTPEMLPVELIRAGSA